MNSSASPCISRRSYYIQVVMNPTEQFDGIMFWQACQVLSKVRIGTKRSGFMHSVVLLTNPDCEDQNGTIIHIRAVTRTQSWCYNQPQLYFLGQRYRRIGRNTHSTLAALLQINVREWSVCSKIMSEKYETSLFLLTSNSARFVIKTADDRLERTR